MERLKYEIGDIVKLKKQHPCGSSEWEILRVGADFRLKCMGCGHQIMVARKLVEKNTKGLRGKIDDFFVLWYDKVPRYTKDKQVFVTVQVQSSYASVM